ncbi:hypothetical protein CXU22_10710 [Akkermansia muciniphila]|uniref:Uncharacterized protein n=1 Tax=Akkermansia muciniphila TaxID=239935 RepID=A0A2N8HB54_9BACT|nr:hypothetical protein CXU22_10710 [Akkermansia muciniphila]
MIPKKNPARNNSFLFRFRPAAFAAGLFYALGNAGNAEAVAPEWGCPITADLSARRLGRAGLPVFRLPAG